MSAAEAAGRKAMLSLLRFLAAGPAELHATDAAGPVLMRADGRRRALSRLVLRAAERGGLAARVETSLQITPAGRMALRRLMAADADPFQAQHRDIALRGDDAGGAIAVNLAESPLSALSRLVRKDGSPWFPADLVAAGDRLRADFTRGQYLPGLSSRLEPVASRGSAARAGGIADLADAALAARARVTAALEALGPDFAGLVVDVCCFLKGLETVERERQWPQRSAKLMLHAGLGMLARHYEPPRRREAGLRAWGADAYRPELSVDLG